MSDIKIIQYDNQKKSIAKFNPKEMEKNPCIVIIAKRRAGKSVLARDLVWYLRDIPSFTVISKTEELNKFYSEFIPKSYIHNEYKSSILENIMDRQKILTDKKNEGKINKDIRTAIIMDDCLADGVKWRNDKQIVNLMYNGRHFHITFILIMQYPMGIGPNLRTNFDYYFLLMDDNDNNQERIQNNYGGLIPKKNFRGVMSQLTNDYGCMVIINCSVESDISKKLFWYKADNTPIKMGQVGSTQYHMIHLKNYKENYEERFIDLKKKQHKSYSKSSSTSSSTSH